LFVLFVSFALLDGLFGAVFLFEKKPMFEIFPCPIKNPNLTPKAHMANKKKFIHNNFKFTKNSSHSQKDPKLRLRTCCNYLA